MSDNRYRQMEEEITMQSTNSEGVVTAGPGANPPRPQPHPRTQGHTKAFNIDHTIGKLKE